MTDSPIAHLCGAIGKPVWILLSYEAFWLWLLERSDSPRYPSMRFFRQQAWGDWGSPFDAASAELLGLALAHRSRCARWRFEVCLFGASRTETNSDLPLGVVIYWW